MGKYIDLSAAQKEEIRRLTQLANRRIKAAHKAYEKDGMSVAPAEVTGGIQIREQWESKNYALSRSVKFESQKEYRQRLNFLRSFEVTRPTMTEYTEIQREKTIKSMETSTGQEVPEALKEIINKMTAPQLSSFWNKYSKKSSRMGLKYSSGENMENTMTEFFAEDKTGLAAGLSTDIATGQYVKGSKIRMKRK